MIPLEVDPIQLFLQWYGEASKSSQGLSGLRNHLRRGGYRFLRAILGGEVPEANAVALATSDAQGHPSVRMVLVKEVSQEGFVFYTDYRSRKAQELQARPRAALAYWWSWPPRQVRVEGSVERVSAEQSDAYWRSRPLGSRLSAAASNQSAPLVDRSDLVARVEHLRQTHSSGDLPRPETWGGYRVVPDRLEFWEGQPNRLHDRVRFQRESCQQPWIAQRLQP